MRRITRYRTEAGTMPLLHRAVLMNREIRAGQVQDLLAYRQGISLPCQSKP